MDDILEITRPLLELLVTLVGPILIGWLATRLATALNVKTEKDRIALEVALRNALHSSASNAWLFALKKFGISFSEIKGLGPADLPKVMAFAKEYVQDKNPDALAKLGVSSKQLEEILLTKLPAVRME